MRAHASRRRRQEPAERSEPRNVAARWAGPKEKQGSRNLQKVDYLYEASTGSKTSVATNGNMDKLIDIAAGNAVPPEGVPLLFVYAYTFGGHKFLKETELVGEDDEERLYLGGAEFVDGQPESYYHGEGRVALTGVKPAFQYKLTDHLGNTMVLFEDKDDDKIITTESMSTDPALVEVLQRNFYYAFGLPMQGPWNHAPADPDMPYLYNGKELEGELGLGWYAYGFRYYDASVGRFVGVDPISSQFPHVSVFNYAENEPVGHIDLHGLQKTIHVSMYGMVNGEPISLGTQVVQRPSSAGGYSHYYNVYSRSRYGSRGTLFVVHNLDTDAMMEMHYLSHKDRIANKIDGFVKRFDNPAGGLQFSLSYGQGGETRISGNGDIGPAIDEILSAFGVAKAAGDPPINTALELFQFLHNSLQVANELQSNETLKVASLGRRTIGPTPDVTDGDTIMMDVVRYNRADGASVDTVKEPFIYSKGSGEYGKSTGTYTPVENQER